MVNTRQAQANVPSNMGMQRTARCAREIVAFLHVWYRLDISTDLLVRRR